MNYYQALQRESDKRWDYTKTNDGRTRPTGYCAGWHEWQDLPVWSDEENAHHRAEWEQKVVPYKAKYHSDGHAVAEEAVECYRQYELDQDLRLGIRDETAQGKCAVCEEWTQLRAMVGMWQCPLCEAHNNREEVEKLYEGASYSASSW